jgi:hypothetical protein
LDRHGPDHGYLDLVAEMLGCPRRSEM